jgi:DNA-binding NtrC family response regulator
MATVWLHVVFLDLHMPALSGLETLTFFRQRHRTVPVIVIAADMDHEMAQQARAGGAFDVVGKPFNLHVLRDLVAQAMRVAPHA